MIADRNTPTLREGPAWGKTAARKIMREVIEQQGYWQGSVARFLPAGVECCRTSEKLVIGWLFLHLWDKPYAIVERNRDIVMIKPLPKRVDCPIHGTEMDADAHHIVPRYRGGADEPDNVVLTCKLCHVLHHAQDYELHYRGWVGLVKKLTGEGINLSQYMAGLAHQRWVKYQQTREEVL